MYSKRCMPYMLACASRAATRVAASAGVCGRKRSPSAASAARAPPSASGSTGTRLASRAAGPPSPSSTSTMAGSRYAKAMPHQGAYASRRERNTNSRRLPQ